ncbi:MAG: UbiX family flavin prenyltransferase [Planctomycetota bacterium]|jgi:4-hydroxy-3-polyprenylbenzoate decarboxylase|nr:MAG: UbiX family flavin prenyltransferase [Planctomycetota bacterium]
MESSKRLVVGISGASGVTYGLRLLELLRPTPIETHLIVSRAAERTLVQELPSGNRSLKDLADAWYPIDDIGAAVASGSFKTKGMIVVPCSVKTLGEIACGIASNLLTRAADVTLKERRRLVLAVRESPLNLIHLRNMVTVTEAGAIVAPPVPMLYAHPKSLEEAITNTACRLLDLFDIDLGILPRWGEQIDPHAPAPKR